MVRKNDLLEYVSQQARKEASRRGLDEDATEDLVSEGRAIVEDLFASITWETVENGVIKSNEPITSWRQRNIYEVESDWRYMKFSRAELQGAAERYLDRAWLHCREIDWVIVNTLTYAEYQATLDFLRAHTMPISRYIARKAESIGWQIGSGLWRMIVLAVKWLLWLGIFIASFIVAPFGPIVWVGITAWWWWRKLAAQKKINKVLASMFATYATLSTVSQSWQIVWDELKKSRETGAVWDGIVYRLVEERLRS